MPLGTSLGTSSGTCWGTSERICQATFVEGFQESSVEMFLGIALETPSLWGSFLKMQEETFGRLFGRVSI